MGLSDLPAAPDDAGWLLRTDAPVPEFSASVTRLERSPSSAGGSTGYFHGMSFV
jgi:hypothetical protein